MDDFYEHICKKSPNGIPYSEAVQLLLWTFLTVGYIPKEFQQLPLNKSHLAMLFSRLSVNGKIITGVSDKAYAAEITHPEHWENLVESLLQRKVTLDESFLGRFDRYV